MTGPFEFVAPTRVRFGAGTRLRLPDMLAGLNPWGVVSSPSVLEKSGISVSLDACREAGIELVSLGLVSPNPRLAECETIVSEARESAVKGMLAVGGGSVMDAAKLSAVAVRHGTRAREVLDDIDAVTAGDVSQPCRLMVAPTTSGTGAEVSRGAIVSDMERGIKTGARGDAVVPDEAIVDPELTLSLSRRHTAETGFDVIAHAVETYLSAKSNRVTDILALAALREAPAALARALRDGSDLEARSTLSFQSWMMGYNLASASTCLPHRMQYPIGAMTDTSHQIGLAAIYPAWARRVEKHSPVRAAEIKDALLSSLAEVPDTPASVVPSTFQEVIVALLKMLDMDVALSHLGVERGQIPELVGDVRGRIDRDPIDPSREDIREIFEDSFTP